MRSIVYDGVWKKLTGLSYVMLTVKEERYDDCDRRENQLVHSHNVKQCMLRILCTDESKQYHQRCYDLQGRAMVWQYG